MQHLESKFQVHTTDALGSSSFVEGMTASIQFIGGAYITPVRSLQLRNRNGPSRGRDDWCSVISPKAIKRVALFTTKTFMEVVGAVHTIYTVRLPRYKVSASIGTYASSMRATNVILDNGSGCIIIRRSGLHLGLQRYECSDYKISPEKNDNGNPPRIP